ncbi:hypothetical protein N8I77_006242 [Diaporthe amygdali]|uniref:Uncharacterized protein n=1 Tax=Phomopsis amygdali TaxID=1214568 RepID=A0AAD9SHD0_PHOAM|nr:hypothetical protein N8I77_006242 [Diaporthe amygdali]
MHFNKNLALATAFAVPSSALATLYEDHHTSDAVVQGKFIVKMKDAMSTVAANEVENLMDTIDYVYNVGSFKGFAGSLDNAALAAVQAHPSVDYIEREVAVRASSYVTQHGAPWGLGRVSHKGPETFTDGTTYVYDDSAGEGVCAYVIDSGIRVDHEEFEGRAESLVNFAGGDDEDTFGHGTHVAGTIGGATYGVAKKVSLYSVKIGQGYETGLDDEIMTSNVIAGMQFVGNDTRTRHCPNGTVANLSFGLQHSRAVNDVAKSLLNIGVFVVVATGNEGRDAGFRSPANEPALCTVGATDKNNLLANFSNHGPVVDILAPGVDILSASIANTTASISFNGTSMSAPHVAGLAACLLASKHLDPKTLCEYMAKTASPLITVLQNNTVNLVAFNGNPEG